MIYTYDVVHDVATESPLTHSLAARAIIDRGRKVLHGSIWKEKRRGWEGKGYIN